MPSHDSQAPRYPKIEMIFDAIADWVRRYRYAIGLRDELAQCGADEVTAIAKDLGMNPTQLQQLASVGPGAADGLKKMLVALRVDPKVLSGIDPRITHDLQRLCITCGDKSRCEHELTAGTAAKNFREFCPNAVTLDALFGADANPIRVQSSSTGQTRKTR